MVERNTQIDIVIPFYNDSDSIWREILHKHMSEEGSSDRQVVGEERYRDWENFKYWFRGVEENCEWVNKVFLLVASESQVPEWLDRDNPKLRIVLHKEFIPEELLPTFNASTIEVFISRIEDLSDNYVYCNDDYFFMNPTRAGMFFVDEYPVYQYGERELEKLDTSGEDGTFYQTLNNGMDLQVRICGDKAHWYAIDHLPVSHKKDFEKEILDEYYDDFIKANSTSRFRSRNNYCSHVFVCLYKDLKPYYKFNTYRNSSYVSVRKDTNFEDYKYYDMVCFNDTQLLNQEDFIDVKNRMLDFLEKKFPYKSTFEK